MMHLTQDDSRALAGHVARTDAVLDSVCSVGVLLHPADAASRERNDKGSIAESVKLTTE